MTRKKTINVTFGKHIVATWEIPCCDRQFDYQFVFDRVLLAQRTLMATLALDPSEIPEWAHRYPNVNSVSFRKFWIEQFAVKLLRDGGFDRDTLSRIRNNRKLPDELLERLDIQIQRLLSAYDSIVEHPLAPPMIHAAVFMELVYDNWGITLDEGSNNIELERLLSVFHAPNEGGFNSLLIAFLFTVMTNFQDFMTESGNCTIH